jgi:hypothetical protein
MTSSIVKSRRNESSTGLSAHSGTSHSVTGPALHTPPSPRRLYADVCIRQMSSFSQTLVRLCRLAKWCMTCRNLLQLVLHMATCCRWRLASCPSHHRRRQLHDPWHIGIALLDHALAVSAGVLSPLYAFILSSAAPSTMLAARELVCA